jgi:hypothetical protein
MICGDRKSPDNKGLAGIVDHAIEAFVGPDAKSPLGKLKVNTIRERVTTQIQEYIGVEPSKAIS